MRKFVLFSFFIVVCAFDFYGSSDKNFEENLIIQQERIKITAQKYPSVEDPEIESILKVPTFSKHLLKYPFAKKFMKKEDFCSYWEDDFKKNCGNLLLPKEEVFFKFYFCRKIIEKNIEKKHGNTFSPFLSDNEDILNDLVKNDIHLFKKTVLMAKRYDLKKAEMHLLGDENFEEEEVFSKYERGVLSILGGEKVVLSDITADQYRNLFWRFVLKEVAKGEMNCFYVKEFFGSSVKEPFISSIVKYRTLLFRFIPTFIYNIFDVGRFLKDFCKYSNDGRYSLSFRNVPLILGKTSPLFFNIFQVDFFFNFPLGVVLSCLDFCAYSILRGNLTKNEKSRYSSSFQKFFLVWRPFVSDDVDIPSILEKSIEIEKKAENEEFFKKRNFEKEESHNAFAPVILKVLTNFVGVNFNIKVKGNYFFSINLMSFVDDFILREYFLDSFNCSNKDLRPSSWSIFYVLDNINEVNKL